MDFTPPHPHRKRLPSIGVAVGGTLFSVHQGGSVVASIKVLSDYMRMALLSFCPSPIVSHPADYRPREATHWLAVWCPFFFFSKSEIEICATHKVRRRGIFFKKKKKVCFVNSKMAPCHQIANEIDSLRLIFNSTPI